MGSLVGIKQNMKLRKYIWFVLLLFVTSCIDTGYIDDLVLNREIVASHDHYESTASFAWIDESLVAYRAWPKGGYVSDAIVEIYDLESRSVYKQLDYSDPDRCFNDTIGHVRELPDGRIGFVFECRGGSQSSPTRIDERLIAWDYELDQTEVLHIYMPPFAPSDFAMSPDMSRLLQEETGDGIFNDLFLVDLDSDVMDSAFSESRRTGSPSWSANSSRRAYGVTGGMPDTSGNIFSGVGGLSAGMDTPWQIVIEDDSDFEVLPYEIVHLSHTALSPANDNLLAFYGKYKNKKGIWLYDIEETELTYLLGNIRSFAWSPDGTAMIIQYCTNTDPATFDKSGCNVDILSWEKPVSTS